MRKLIAAFFLAAFANAAFGHLQEEELSVVEVLVRRIMASPGWDDNVQLNVGGALEDLPFQTYDDLFLINIPTNQAGWSWSPHERKESFENFIAMIPELSTNGLYRAIGTHGGVALSFCREHGVSNVLHSAMRILTFPHSVARSSALGVFEEFAVPTDEVNAMAAQILTNKTAETEYFRSYFLGTYAGILERNRERCPPEAFTNGVALVIRSVSGADGAIALDKLLLSSCPGYSCSSNRLAISERALDGRWAPVAWSAPAVERYFAPITNQLLNAPQPLPEVEALRGL